MSLCQSSTVWSSTKSLLQSPPISEGLLGLLWLLGLFGPPCGDSSNKLTPNRQLVCLPQDFIKTISIDSALWSGSVIESASSSICLRYRKTPTSWGRGDLWLKNIFLILDCDDKHSCRKSRFGWKPFSAGGRGGGNGESLLLFLPFAAHLVRLGNNLFF